MTKPEEDTAGLILNYLHPHINESLTHSLTFPVVINCSGFEDLNLSSSELISNIISKKICKVNETKKGFEVNENFEANDNLYIMGPLLRGYITRQLHFWHVESAPRIHSLSTLLAETLWKTMSK